MIDLLALHKKLLDFVDTDITQAMDGKIELSPGFKDTCVYLFTKSTKTYRAIQHLCNNGYGEDAIILSRSLLENLINFAYIANPQQEEERERRAKLFVGWIIIDFQRKLRDLKNTDAVRIQIEKNLKTYKPDWDVNKLHQEECNNHKTKGKETNNRSWSVLSIKNMATEIGLLELYYKEYWLYSQIVHPHPGGSPSYMKYDTNRDIVTNDMPSNAWIEKALLSSIDCYIMLVGLINNVFDLKLDDKIKAIDTETANL